MHLKACKIVCNFYLEPNKASKCDSTKKRNGCNLLFHQVLDAFISCAQEIRIHDRKFNIFYFKKVPVILIVIVRVTT